MDQKQTISVLEALANGVDPMTGEVLPAASPYNSPEVIRALFHALKLIPKPKRLKKSVEEKQQANLSKGLPKNYGLPWSEEDLSKVIHDYQSGFPVENIAQEVHRLPTSVVHVLEKHSIITVDVAISLNETFKSSQ